MRIGTTYWDPVNSKTDGPYPDISQGLLASPALGTYHRPPPEPRLGISYLDGTTSADSVCPSVKLYGVGRGRDQDTFVAERALSGFDDATLDNKSFTDKRKLIRSCSLGSSIKTTLYFLYMLMERAFNVFKRAQAALVGWQFTSKATKLVQESDSKNTIKRLKAR